MCLCARYLKYYNLKKNGIHNVITFNCTRTSTSKINGPSHSMQELNVFEPCESVQPFSRKCGDFSITRNVQYCIRFSIFFKEKDNIGQVQAKYCNSLYINNHVINVQRNI